ncbi:hypothetical protein [Sulfitobacter sp. R18_1]|uniref:hypothetical protein n=1 Tax=Sulfitobacter sp. R18_1 TaxID=2821104 RepID=UPI001ADA54C3|nr:hypothetical protein [Sulfitobacter sp. R18_1]MBO9428163.1 hypothetical protein [Sulfitobacter sp. R18_1]
MPKKKTHYVLVRVSAPEDMGATQVRKEVRSLINDQCNHSADEGDIRAAKVSAVPKSWVGDKE